MTNTIILALSIFSFMFFVAYIITLRNLIKIKKSLTKEILDNFTMLQLLEDMKSKELSDTEVHNENFIKFLSDSRDWAFQYIEDVQNGLKEFVKEVDKDIQHFDEYGDVISTTRPDYWSIKKISAAYKKLKTLLPDEEVEK
jgi:hypothetical protein